jgi:hypothetical protein
MRSGDDARSRVRAERDVHAEHPAAYNVSLVLYAGEPLVHNGPFVAGSPIETRQFYQRLRAGEFPLLSEIARA